MREGHQVASALSQQVPLCALLVVAIIVSNSRLEERLGWIKSGPWKAAPQCLPAGGGVNRVGPLHPWVPCSQV